RNLSRRWNAVPLPAASATTSTVPARTRNARAALTPFAIKQRDRNRAVRKHCPEACASFSPLKRVVKGHCSCRPLRERIHTTPEKVKGKCLTSPHKSGVQGAKPPAGVWGTLSGGQVVPSQLLSPLFSPPKEASYEWISA